MISCEAPQVALISLIALLRRFKRSLNWDSTIESGMHIRSNKNPMTASLKRMEKRLRKRFKVGRKAISDMLLFSSETNTSQEGE